MRISDWSSDVCSSDLVFVSPRVIAPVNNSLTNMLITVDQERWPMIAAPGIIRWMMEETDIFQGYASCQQVGGSQGFHRVVRHIDADLFTQGNFPEDRKSTRLNSSN